MEMESAALVFIQIFEWTVGADEYHIDFIK